MIIDKYIVYVLEIYRGDAWHRAEKSTYACLRGQFSKMLDAVNLTPAQRLKRLHAAPIGGKPAFRYIASTKSVIRT